MKKRFCWASLALMAIGLSQGVAAPGAIADQPAAVVQAYRLGVADQVHLVVFGEDRLTGDYLVEGDGTIAFPLLGPVPAKGRSVAELAALVQAGLNRSGFVNNASVSGQLVQSRPFFIQGEVARPGRYPTVPGMTVMQAIVMAGDFTYRASKRTVFLRREGDSHEYRIPPDVSVTIQPGDILRVAERHW